MAGSFHVRTDVDPVSARREVNGVSISRRGAVSPPSVTRGPLAGFREGAEVTLGADGGLGWTRSRAGDAGTTRGFLVRRARLVLFTGSVVQPVRALILDGLSLSAMLRRVYTRLALGES